MIVARAPGKLFIAGEHAVVDAGQPAVLVAVDRFLTVTLRETPASDSEPPTGYAGEAIRVIEQFRQERGLPQRHYEFAFTSELKDQRGQKFGLGSSAAVTVAVIDALNELYGLHLTRFERFQFGLLATITQSPRASGGDVAASTYGGWILYSSPDRALLAAHREAHGVTAALDAELWQGCSVTNLPSPRSTDLLVGWTGSPASTEHLVAKVQVDRDARDQAHERFVQASRACVTELVNALQNDETKIPATITKVRGLLRELGDDTGVAIETNLLRTLCDDAERHGAAAKPSGAGGGDCGIVLAGRNASTDAIRSDWQAHGILDLELSVYCPEGAGE